MPDPAAWPGVYVEEPPGGPPPIAGVATAETAFVDFFARGPVDHAVRVASFAEFTRHFGGLDRRSEASHAIAQFFLNGGTTAWVVRVALARGEAPGGRRWASAAPRAILGSAEARSGLHALDAVAAPWFVGLLCVPAAARLPTAAMQAVYAGCARHCAERRAFLLVDVPPDVTTRAAMAAWVEANAALRGPNAAVYFPCVHVADPLDGGGPRVVGASGTMAGVFARTDAARGVWKAPAGPDATLRGATPVAGVDEDDHGMLNPLGVNVLRTLPRHGSVAWGARTLDGADARASEWKYVPVRRTALFLQESLARGLAWAALEPNGEPLWARIRLAVDAFLHALFRQGAFQGATPREAYLVKCDATTTTAADVARGVVHVVVGFAPTKPAELVILTLRLITAPGAP